MGSTEIKDDELRPNRHFSLQNQTEYNMEHTTPVISDGNLLEQRMTQVIIKLFNMMSNLFKITERMFWFINFVILVLNEGQNNWKQYK